MSKKKRYISVNKGRHVLSGFERYIILADNSQGRLSPTMESYDKFKMVIEAVTAISKSSVSTYKFRNKEYKKPFNSNVAAMLLNKFSSGMFDRKVKDVALQIGVNVYLPFTYINKVK